MADDHEYRYPEHGAYPPRPPEDPPWEQRARRRRVLGCGVWSAAGVLAAILAISWLSSLAPGCEFSSFDGGGTSSGKDSERVDVLVTPTTGLRAGQAVQVASRAFDPGTVVGVTVCLEEADTEQLGEDACDLVQGARYAVGDDGVLDVTYPVPRQIRVGRDVYDCGARPERCLVVAAARNDYDHSGGQPISFDPAEPAPTGRPPSTRVESDHLTVGAQPEGPVPWGTKITVVASGFQPGEPLLAAWCSDAFDQVGPMACEPVDEEAALDAIVGSGALVSDLHATAEGGATVTLRARRELDPPFGSETDCRPPAGRCSIVIAAAADTKRSAVSPYTLEPE